jgi:hypothetical protein
MKREAGSAKSFWSQTGHADAMPEVIPCIPNGHGPLTATSALEKFATKTLAHAAGTVPPTEQEQQAIKSQRLARPAFDCAAEEEVSQHFSTLFD